MAKQVTKKVAKKRVRKSVQHGQALKVMHFHGQVLAV